MKKAKLLGLAALIGIGSYFVGRNAHKFPCSKNTEQKRETQEEITKELFETFNLSGDSLSSKLGFKFKVPKLEMRRIPGTEKFPRLGMFYNVEGVEYSFEVDKFLEESIEDLTLTLYDGTSPMSNGFICIQDSDNDQNPNWIYISDGKNNTKVNIRQKEDGTFKFNGPIDSEGAKNLYEWCSGIYQDFRKDYKIDERINNYDPLLEIKVREKEYKVIENTMNNF